MIYFDNGATTKPCDAAIKAANQALEAEWGNPSSLHSMGVWAEKMVNDARERVASVLNAEPGEITFTSSATESNNTAVFSAALTRGKRRKKIITSAFEHPSVSQPVKRLEEKGFEVVRIYPDKTGKIDPREVLSQIDSNTLLVSLMLVNNETGVITDVSKIFKAIKARDKEIYTHTDAVQGFLKMNINSKTMYADMISISGHKVYVPKGIGALYVKKGVNLLPFIVGGGQEKGKRSGTESTVLISAFGAAVNAYKDDISERLEKVNALREHLKEKIKGMDGVYLNEFDNALPYINSLTVERYKSKTLLHFLEEREIYVSSGSACSKGKKSEVLKAFGYNDSQLDSTLRISFCTSDTKEQIDELVAALKDARERLVKIR
ncbi:MAG: cysteine desulfurase [Ruminococcus sp.]|nr:cysteine desulfurase [Ruminococcus sp.]